MAPREPAASPCPQYPASITPNTGAIPAQTGSVPAQPPAAPATPQLSTQIAPVADPIITVRGLRKTYDSPGGDPIVALDNISIDFPRGQFTAIMGPSGSGKSSLLHCIVGLDSFQEGIVKVAGKNLATMSSAELTEFRRVTVGFIFQSYNLIPTLSARENIEIAAELQRHQVDHKHFKDLVNRLDLGKRLNVFPSQLSGGQQQKVACARALLTRPAVVVADEPTGSLDSESAAEVLAFLRGAAADWGQSVVMVTHEPDAAQYASRVLFLHDGRLVAQLTNPTREAILEAQQTLGQLRSGGSVGSGGSAGLDVGSLGAISGIAADFTGKAGVNPFNPANSSLADAAGGSAPVAGNAGGSLAESPVEPDQGAQNTGNSLAPHETETPETPAVKPPEKPKNRRSSWRNRKKRRPVADPALAQTFANLGVAVPDSQPNELADSLAIGQFKWPSLSEASPDMNEGDNELLGQPLGLFARHSVPEPPAVSGEPVIPTDSTEPVAPAVSGNPSGPVAPPVPAAQPTLPVMLGQSTEPTEPAVSGNPTGPVAPPAPATSALNPAVPIVTSAFTVTPGGRDVTEPDLTTPNVTMTDATQTGVGFLRRVAEPGYGFVPDNSAAPSDSGVVAGDNSTGLSGLDGSGAVDVAASLGAIPDSGSMGIAASQNSDTGGVPVQTKFNSEVPSWAQQLAPAAAEPGFDPGFEPGASLAASGWALSDTGQTRPIPGQPAPSEAAKSAGIAAGQTGHEAGSVGAGVTLGQTDPGVFAAQARVGGVVGISNPGVAAAQVGQAGYGAAAFGNSSNIVPGQTKNVAGSANFPAPRGTELTPATSGTVTAPPAPIGFFGGTEATAAGSMPGIPGASAFGAASPAPIPGLTEGQAPTPIPTQMSHPAPLREPENEPGNAAGNARPVAGTEAATGAATGARENEGSGEPSRPRRRRRASIDPQEAELAGQNELLQMIAQAEKLLAASGAAISDAQDALTSPEKSGKSKETEAVIGGTDAKSGAGGGASVDRAGGGYRSGGNLGVASTLGGTSGGASGAAKSGTVGGSVRGSVRQGGSASLGASPVSSVPSAATTNIYRPATSTFTSVKGNASLAELARSLGLEDVITAGRDQSGGTSSPGAKNLGESLGLATGGSGGQRVVRAGTGAIPDRLGHFNPHSSPDSLAARGVAGTAFGSGVSTTSGAGSAPGAPGTTSSGFRSFMAGASGQTSPGDSGSTRGATPDQDLLIARADAMLAQANAQSLDLQRSLLDLENPAGSPSQYHDAARLAPHESATPNHNPTPTIDPKGR